MKRLSVIDFVDQTYALPGKVDEYMLRDFQPVLDELDMLETTEVLKVFYTVYAYQDGIEAGSDMSAEQVQEIAPRIVSLIEEGTLVPTAEGKIELAGTLPEPFEDYYGLEGAAREEYLANKAEAQKELDALIASCHEAGMSDEETEQWLRYNLYAVAEDEDVEE